MLSRFETKLIDSHQQAGAFNIHEYLDKEGERQHLSEALARYKCADCHYRVGQSFDAIHEKDTCAEPQPTEQQEYAQQSRFIYFIKHNCMNCQM